MLAFKFRTYLPIELNLQLLISGLTGCNAAKSLKDPKISDERKEKEMLIVSDFNASEAITEIIVSFLRVIKIKGETIESLLRLVRKQNRPATGTH